MIAIIAGRSHSGVSYAFTAEIYKGKAEHKDRGKWGNVCCPGREVRQVRPGEPDASPSRVPHSKKAIPSALIMNEAYEVS